METTTEIVFTLDDCWCFSPMGPFTFNINDDSGQGQTGHTPQTEFAAGCFADVVKWLQFREVIKKCFSGSGRGGG